MKITKPDDVLFLQGYVQRGGRKLFVATAGYVVEPDGALMPEADAWAWLMELFPDQPFDTGLSKSRGVFAVAGRAYAPDGQPVGEMAVQATFGGLSKTLHVFGRRHWKKSVLGWHPSQAEPFTTMPIDLAHAYGGPDDAENPAGMGWIKDVDAAQGAPLPCVELPDAPLRVPGEPPREVATFGNLALGAPSRMRWMGTVDERWQAERFPGLPDDLDERWFDGVPQDQCAPDYWQGDESWSVTGMNAAQATVEGRLPELRPRLLVQRAPVSLWDSALDAAPVGVPQEMPLTLDTVWLFPNDERVLLLYRAVIPVQREDAGDIGALGVFTESAAQPAAPLDELTRQWVEEDFSLVDKSPDILQALGASAAAAVLVERIHAHRKEKAEQERKEQERKDEQARRQEPPAHSPDVPAHTAAQPAGEGPAAAVVPAATPAAAEPGGLSHAHRAQQEAERWANDVWDEICRSYDESWEEGREMLRLLEKENQADFPDGFGVDPGPFVPPPRPDLAGTAVHSLPDNLSEMLQDEIEASLEEGRELYRKAIDDAMADHPEMARELQNLLDGPASAIAPPTVTQMEQILSDMPPDLKARAEAEIQAMEDSFQNLGDEILQTFQGGAGGAGVRAGGSAVGGMISAAPGVSGQGGDAPFAPAGLAPDSPAPAATPPPADGQAAKPQAGPATQGEGAAAPAPGMGGMAAAMTAAAAPQMLVGADLRNADLGGADYAGALLQDCDFSGAQLAGASFAGATLKDCRFAGADLSGANLDDADITDSSWRGAALSAVSAQRAVFSGSDLSGADFSEARLASATFERCRLDKARFSQATMTDTTLSDVVGEHVDFSRSQARGLRIDEGSTLARASFAGAVLTAASIQDSHLPQAVLDEATLDDAFMKASDMSGSVANGASACRVVFKDVRLADAAWLRTNLMEAVFEQTLLHRVDFSGSNLYAVQARTADVRGLQLRGAVLDRCHILQEHGRA